MQRRKRQIQEYLNRKEKEQIEESIRKSKEKLKECYDNDIVIPHELKERTELISEVLYNLHYDENQEDIKVFITTSREPSSMLREFAKRISLIFNGKLISRGQMNQSDFMNMIISDNVGLLITVNESKGSPSNISFNFIKVAKNFHFTILNYKVNKSMEKRTVKENCALMVEGIENKIGLEFKNLISLIFKMHDEFSRVLVLKNDDDLISFRHFFLEKQIVEDFFNFDIKLYKVDNEVEEEFVSRNFINSTKKVF